MFLFLNFIRLQSKMTKAAPNANHVAAFRALSAATKQS